MGLTAYQKLAGVAPVLRETMESLKYGKYNGVSLQRFLGEWQIYLFSTEDPQHDAKIASSAELGTAFWQAKELIESMRDG